MIRSLNYIARYTQSLSHGYLSVRLNRIYIMYTENIFSLGGARKKEKEYVFLLSIFLIIKITEDLSKNKKKNYTLIRTCSFSSHFNNAPILSKNKFDLSNNLMIMCYMAISALQFYIYILISVLLFYKKYSDW